MVFCSLILKSNFRKQNFITSRDLKNLDQASFAERDSIKYLLDICQNRTATQRLILKEHNKVLCIDIKQIKPKKTAAYLHYFTNQSNSSILYNASLKSMKMLSKRQYINST